MNSTASVVIERCPLCNGREWIEDSVPEPNLYSEKIALILGQDEARVLREHANWRCRNCGLVSKRRWFAPGVIRALFHGEVAVHPKGWDAVLNRFSERGLLQTVETWALALDRQAEPEIRRGQRELRSLLDSITDPRGFDSAEILTAIDHRDLQQIRGAVPAIVGSIGEPAPFKRFSGRACFGITSRVGRVASTPMPSLAARCGVFCHWRQRRVIASRILCETSLTTGVPAA